MSCAICGLKEVCSPKDISSFIAGEKERAVFEGFFDFLSYKTISQNQAVTPTVLLF